MSSPNSRNGASVVLRDIVRVYGDVHAVDGVSLDIEPGEFVTLLGPSGSGKTTSLNIVAGFEQPTSGDVLVDGRPVTGLPPHRRNMGMVFQSYALFPHMTAAENIAFPLRERRMPRQKVRAEVARVLEMVRLADFGDRYPSQMSGGQQQRIALARAIVYSPKVLLMDEPLGALDKKLRSWLQEEIRRIHQELQTTVLFVTHDQDEALALSDRIALFRDGQIVQSGTPEDLWDRPLTPFVADFLGESNLLQGTLESPDTFVASGQRFEVTDTAGIAVGEPHTLLLRPEKVHVGADSATARRNVVSGVLQERMFMGASMHLRVRTALGSLRAIVSGPADDALRVGTEVVVSWHSVDARVLHGVDHTVAHVADDEPVTEEPAA